MPAVTTPTAANVRAWTGLNRYISGAASDAAYDTTLADFITTAEAVVALRIGEALFDSAGHTTREAIVLARAIAYRAAAGFLRWAATQVVTGTHEPLLMLEPDQIEETAQAWEATAEEILELVATGEAPSVKDARTGFSDDDENVFTIDGANW